MELTDITGLAASVLLIVALIAVLFRIVGLKNINRCLLCLILVVFSLLPMGEISLAGYVRGMVGDLSITTLLLLVAALITGVADIRLVESEQVDNLCWLILSAAVMFYPMALGMGVWDPYTSGYGSFYLLACLFVVALLAWCLRQTMIVACISLAVLLYAVGWYESNNIWDYLLDPLLALYAAFICLRSLMGSSKKSVSRAG